MEDGTNEARKSGLILLERDPNARKLARIAELFGIQSQVVAELPSRPCCVILSGRDYDEYAPVLNNGTYVALVYHAGESTLLSHQFKTFAHSSERIDISADARHFTGPLTGLSLHAPVTDHVFGSAEDFVPLITADPYPLLLMNDRLFLLATPDVVDIDRPVGKGCEPHREFFSRLVPFVLFIKWAFKDRCWHLNTYSACITIDDPLLRSTYGFIEYEAFNDWLKRNRLAATFAFIPWNYKRSDPKVVDLFKRNAERLSIAVHGCDHIHAEFATTNKARLEALAAEALARMAHHQQEYGINHDLVMIYPQGKFSREARQAIDKVGFRADVNSTVFPTNYDGKFTIRELLGATLLAGSELPLYRRRYPDDVFDFACDMLFENPVIITLHHHDFEAGYAQLQEFTERLQAANPSLTWMPLGDLITRSYWTKTEADGTVTTRNPAAKRPRTPLRPKDSVLEYTWLERLHVAARRYLSEFRDNVLHKSRLLRN